VTESKDIGRKAARASSIDTEDIQSEIIAVVLLGLVILTLHFLSFRLRSRQTMAIAPRHARQASFRYIQRSRKNRT